MSKCRHLNVDIIEHILSRHTHHIREGSRVEISSDCGPVPRHFDVVCKDCGLEKTYRYIPGEFGPQSSPRWLYERIERVTAQRWRVEMAPDNRRKKA